MMYILCLSLKEKHTSCKSISCYYRSSKLKVTGEKSGEGIVSTVWNVNKQKLFNVIINSSPLVTVTSSLSVAASE